MELKSWIKNKEQMKWVADYLSKRGFASNRRHNSDEEKINEALEHFGQQDNFKFIVSKMKNAWRKRKHDENVKKKNKVRCQFNISRSSKNLIDSQTKKLGHKSQHEYIEALLDQERNNLRALQDESKKLHQKLSQMEETMEGNNKAFSLSLTKCYIEIENLIKENLILKAEIKAKASGDGFGDGLTLDMLKKAHTASKEIKKRMQNRVRAPQFLNIPMLGDKNWTDEE